MKQCMIKRGVDKLFDIRKKTTLLVPLLFFVLVVVVIVLYWLVESMRSVLTFGVAVIGGAAVVYAAYYTAISVRMASLQRRIDNAFQQLNLLNSGELGKLQLTIEDSSSDKGVPSEERWKKIMADPELKNAIGTVFGLWEDMALAIRFRHSDEEVLFRSVGFLIPRHYDNFRGYIEKVLEREKDKTIWCEMDKLATAWKQNKSLVDNRTFL